MYQHPRHRQIKSLLSRPIQDVIPIATLVLGAKVRPGIAVTLQPFPSDEAGIGVALQREADTVDAMR